MKLCVCVCVWGVFDVEVTSMQNTACYLVLLVLHAATQTTTPRQHGTTTCTTLDCWLQLLIGQASQ
jgi:hypothetical protein